MYFQKRKNAIQVFAVRGYDPKKKRSVIRYLGSIFLNPPRPDEKLLLSVNDEERKELQSYLETLVHDDFVTHKLNHEEQIILAFRQALSGLSKIDESQTTFSRESVDAIRGILDECRECLSSITRRMKKMKKWKSASPATQPLLPVEFLTRLPQKEQQVDPTPSSGKPSAML